MDGIRRWPKMDLGGAGREHGKGDNMGAPDIDHKERRWGNLRVKYSK